MNLGWAAGGDTIQPTTDDKWPTFQQNHRENVASRIFKVLMSPQDLSGTRGSEKRAAGGWKFVGAAQSEPSRTLVIFAMCYLDHYFLNICLQAFICYLGKHALKGTLCPYHRWNPARVTGHK